MTTDDGTGLVHIAPAFGEDDYNAARAHALFDPQRPETLFNPVTREGTYGADVRAHDGGSYQGRTVKDPALAEELIADLDARGLLFKRTDYEHSYPHCWRCDTPLIYYAKPSWYIATSKIRDRMMAANETIAWYPPHIKHGRFGDWLSNNVDWALSRERYWGTPLPVWRCEQGHTLTIGSFSELEQRSGRTLGDHHRPYVDEVELPCPHGYEQGSIPSTPGESGEDHGTSPGEVCGLPMTRVPEVIDVWFDSGSMPFAQHHFPHEHEQQFQKEFPANFICEALDQTRGWFYSLLAVSTLLFDRSSYENVVCLGLILDGDGQKMSKSKGNTVEPWQVLDQVRRRRVPLVLLHLQAALGRLPLLRGGDRRGRAPVPQAAVEHLLLLRALRQRQRRGPEQIVRGDRRPDPSRWRPRPLGPLANRRHRRHRRRAPRRLRRHHRRARHRRPRRRSLQLVRAPIAPTLLGRRPRRLRDPARLPAHGLQAARPLLPLRRR